MQVKKKSLINEKSGWELAPAYGLLNAIIGNPDDNEELALSGAKKRKRCRKHFEQFGLSWLFLRLNGRGFQKMAKKTRL